MTDHTTSDGTTNEPPTPQTFTGRLKWVLGWFYYLILGGIAYAASMIVLFVLIRPHVLETSGPEGFTFLFGIWTLVTIAIIGSAKL